MKRFRMSAGNCAMKRMILAASISGTASTRARCQTEIDPEARVRFAEVYASHDPARAPSRAGERAQAASISEDLEPVFDSLRKMLPVDVHPILEDLENICEEERPAAASAAHLFLAAWLASGACSALDRAACSGRDSCGNRVAVLNSWLDETQYESARATHRPAIFPPDVSACNAGAGF